MTQQAPLLLAIESSCDETAASVLRGQTVLSSVIASQVDIHARYGGVVPEIASRNHLVAIAPTIDSALKEAGVTIDELEAIAATAGPGLGGCLLVGFQTGKAIAWARNLPFVPVDHIRAHIHAPFLQEPNQPEAPVPSFPYIALAVSGGHTSILEVTAPGEATTLGATIDDAAGECFDKIAKMMGLPYPGGIHIDRLAQVGNPKAYPLPRPLQHRGLDFSFSGLKTAVRLTYERLVAEGIAEQEQANLAASAQAAIVEVLVDKTLKAARERKISTVVAAGGVACNSGLRKTLLAKSKRQKIQCFIAKPRYCSDNAAMIGGLGAALLAQGHFLEGDALLDANIFVTNRKRRV